MVRTILNLAATKDYSSVAFPALGTGNLSYPADQVAKNMFDTILEFDASNGKTTKTTDIRLVLYDKDPQTCQVRKFTRNLNMKQ